MSRLRTRDLIPLPPEARTLVRRSALWGATLGLGVLGFWLTAIALADEQPASSFVLLSSELVLMWAFATGYIASTFVALFADVDVADRYRLVLGLAPLLIGASVLVIARSVAQLMGGELSAWGAALVLLVGCGAQVVWLIGLLSKRA